MLAELILAILIARLMALILDRFEIPAITAYILTGIILGPSVFNLISAGMPEDLVTLTFLFLLFYAGLNVDFKGIREYIGRSLVITFGGVGLTIFLAVLFLMTYMGFELLPALVIAIAISNTATEIVVVMLEHSYEVSDEFRRVLVMASFIDDIVAILFMSLLKGAIVGEVTAVSFELLRLMGFFAVSLFIMFLVMKYAPRLIYPLVVNWDYLLFLSSVIFFGLVFAAYEIGISMIFGAYIAGLVIGMLRLVHDPTLVYTVRVEEFVSRMSTVLEFFIIPIFFVYIGYNTLVNQLLSPLSLIILA
ncbi:MAG: cation:proton antiporter, partial [Desulfurococcales archaeon]|nr:cation:proton antiporter [Desulfurococcales archaeon]